MADRNDDRFSSPAALRLARELAARSSDRPKSVAPGYVLGTDADGNTILIPTDVQPSGRGGIFDNAAREFVNYGPRTSDFTEGTANAYNAGQQYVQQGRENMQYNPAFGAIQRAGGTLMSAMSPLAGVASSISKPIGRYFGPAPERAADVATTVAPFFGGAGRGSKVRPMEGRALELTERPAPEFIGPPELQGPRQITPQTLIGPPEMQGPRQPFRVNARMKARPGDPEFIGPSEQIGPQLPRQGSPEFIGPSDFVGPRQPPRPGDPSFIGPSEQIGPRLQRPGDFIGPPEMQGPRELIGPRQQRPGDFIGPPEMQGPRQLPRPTDAEFIGPREQIGPQLPPRPGDPSFIGPSEFIGPPEFIGPQRPFMAGRMSEPTAVGTMGAGALTLARSMSPAGQPVGSGRGPMIEEPDARANYQFAQDAVGSGRGSMLPNADDRVAYEKAQALDAAKQRMAAIQSTGNTAGLPPARPRENGLASLFSNPISTRELFNRAEANPDDSGAYMRAERQYAATHRDAPSVDLSKLDPDTGMKRGGAANGKPDKNEAIHRALDIISHLVGHRR